MVKKIKQKPKTLLKEDLEKTGEAVGELFKGLFKGVAKILDVAQEMEQKGEQQRSYTKTIKGFTKNDKEFRGQAGWRVKTGIDKAFPKKRIKAKNNHE